jgi:iron complex outermembrane receptor protein
VLTLKYYRSPIILTAALLNFSPYAWADSQDEKSIIQLSNMEVTANKVQQNSQEIADSIVVLTGDQMDEQGITSFNDLVGRIGNLHNIQTGSTALMSIRGIGQRLNNPGIGIYVDDVQYLDHFSALANLDLVNVERLEILRGPQGTLYGGNTQGGVINIITRQPDNEFHAKASLDIGNV